MNSAKKLCRSTLCGIIALIICITFLSGCEEQKDKYAKPTEKFFVNDFSDVITEEDEQTIYNKGVALQEKTTAQAVVATIDSTDGDEIADYALEMGRKWKLGDEEKDNGILVLLATEDRQIYIAVGYGLEGALPDSKTGRLLDVYAIPYLKDDDFSTGVTEVYKALVNEVYLEYGVEPEENYTPIEQIPDTEDDIEPYKVIISWAVMLVFVAIFFIIAKKRGVHVFFFPGGFGGTGGFGGGYHSGGGFSGGGGSFGGGGAGRGF